MDRFYKDEIDLIDENNIQDVNIKKIGPNMS